MQPVLFGGCTSVTFVEERCCRHRKHPARSFSSFQEAVDKSRLSPMFPKAETTATNIVRRHLKLQLDGLSAGSPSAAFSTTSSAGSPSAASCDISSGDTSSDATSCAVLGLPPLLLALTADCCDRKLAIQSRHENLRAKSTGPHSLALYIILQPATSLLPTRSDLPSCNLSLPSD